MNAPPGHVRMTNEELEAANERIRIAREQAAADRQAAIERGEVYQHPEKMLDQPKPEEGDEGEGPVIGLVQEEQRQADLDILLALREMQGADLIRWKIFRMSDPTGRKGTGFLTTWPTTLLSIEKIQDQFGAGTYRIRGTYQNGRFAGSRTVEIAEDTARSQPKSETVVQTVQEPGTGSGSIQELMLMLQQQNDQRRSEETERRETARRDRLELLTILAPVASAVLPALLGNRGPDLGALLTAMKPAPAPTLLETMAALKELTPQPVLPSGPGPIDTALKLFDKFTDMAPKGAGETGWADILKELVRTVGPGMAPMMGQLAQAAATARARQSAQPQVALSAPTAGPPNLYGGTDPSPEPSAVRSVPTVYSETPSPQNGADTSGVASQDDDMNALQMLRMVPWLKGQIEMLLVRAARGSDPELYAEVVLDSIPENVSGDTLIEFLQRTDWFQMLAQFDSRVQQHAQWFANLRAEIFKAADAIKASMAQPQRSAPPAAKPAPEEPDVPKGPPSLLG